MINYMKPNGTIFSSPYPTKHSEQGWGRLRSLITITILITGHRKLLITITIMIIWQFFFWLRLRFQLHTFDIFDYDYDYLFLDRSITITILITSFWLQLRLQLQKKTKGPWATSLTWVTLAYIEIFFPVLNFHFHLSHPTLGVNYFNQLAFVLCQNAFM